MTDQYFETIDAPLEERAYELRYQDRYELEDLDYDDIYEDDEEEEVLELTKDREAVNLVINELQSLFVRIRQVNQQSIKLSQEIIALKGLLEKQLVILPSELIRYKIVNYLGSAKAIDDRSVQLYWRFLIIKTELEANKNSLDIDYLDDRFIRLIAHFWQKDLFVDLFLMNACKQLYFAKDEIRSLKYIEIYSENSLSYARDVRTKLHQLQRQLICAIINQDKTKGDDLGMFLYECLLGDHLIPT